MSIIVRVSTQIVVAIVYLLFARRCTSFTYPPLSVFVVGFPFFRIFCGDFFSFTRSFCCHGYNTNNTFACYTENQIFGAIYLLCWCLKCYL